MAGYLTAPPREQVYVVSAVYGSLMGAYSLSRCRLWVLLEDGDPARPFGRICRNNPSSGQPLYTDLGPIASVVSRHKQLDLVLVDGAQFTLVEAPCVCGAGATGMAGPTESRHEVHRVRTDNLDWLTSA